MESASEVVKDLVTKKTEWFIVKQTAVLTVLELAICFNLKILNMW
jgi:hypothetical protein